MSIRKHIRKDGSISYEARYKYKGIEHTKTFQTANDAQSWLTEQQFYKVIPSRATTHTALQFAKEAELYKKKSPSWYVIDKLLEYLSPIRLNSLDYRQMREILDKICMMPNVNNPTKQISEATARKNYFVLKRAIDEYCKEHSIFLNPLTFRIKLPKAWANERQGRITDQEINDLVSRMPVTRQEFFRDLFFFVIQTACRKQEALGARFDEFKDGWFHIPASREKTKKGRSVPYYASISELIEKRRKQYPNSDLLFPDQPGERQFSRLIQNARPEDSEAVLHSLRHESISRMVEKTPWKCSEIMKITGHTRWETFGKYHKLREHMSLPDGRREI